MFREVGEFLLWLKRTVPEGACYFDFFVFNARTPLSAVTARSS